MTADSYVESTQLQVSLLMAPKPEPKKQTDGIIVSAQQSRFHLDATSTSSKEVSRLNVY